MRILVSILSLFVALSACKVYSFTGANINPDIGTISVAYIYNKSGNGPASASDVFTNLLKDKMNTTTGKQIAQDRHRYMEDFLEQFYAEWEGKK